MDRADKATIDRLIPLAYDVLRRSGIAHQTDPNQPGLAIKSGWRRQVSAFGSAITMGSLWAPIAFFAKTSSGSDLPRDELCKAIAMMLAEGRTDRQGKTLVQMIDTDREPVTRAEIINATVALKLAMNLYRLEDDARQP